MHDRNVHLLKLGKTFSSKLENDKMEKLFKNLGLRNLQKKKII